MSNIWIPFLSFLPRPPPPRIQFILAQGDGPESGGCHPVIEEGEPEGQFRPWRDKRARARSPWHAVRPGRGPEVAVIGCGRCLCYPERNHGAGTGPWFQGYRPKPHGHLIR